MIKIPAVWRTTAAIALLAGTIGGTWPGSAEASAASGALQFADVRDNFAAAAIRNMAALHIITGTTERTFEPDKTVTRAELMTMLDRLLLVEPVESAISSFADVPRSAWFYRWVQPAVQLGLAQGTSDDSFEPDRPVTREEAAVLIARALKQPIDTAAVPSAPLYRDQSRIQSWALPAVYRLSRLGLMDGDGGSFRPASPMTRQEAAVLLDRIWLHPGWAQRIQAAQPAPIQLGWQYGQTTAQYERQVVSSGINTLSPRAFFLNKNGTVENNMDPALVAWAHGKGKRVWAMVGNRSDQAVTHAQLSDPERRRTLVGQLAGLARQYGLDGLNIDFENMSPQDRDAFTAFAAELKQALSSIPAILSVNVSPDFGTDWTEVFDYARLGQAADYVVLMGYDEHWGGSGDPGPVSSLPWLRQGLTALLKQVPASRSILALPLYNRDWKTEAGGTTSEDISLLQQNALVAGMHAKTSWDGTLGQYYASYGSASTLHLIWLEDGRSLSMKATLGQSLGMAGFAYWYMGGESPDVWPSLANARRFAALTFP
ncbi:S-layer homology domain-containing protein [Cohnella sp. JJ-181]|uniref:S-layer homology domain-containing protein n=1 Tax=Cohnella rhizoplanae TaxID=2974897 RepID=UPI0022FFBF94|nr:S-layer homology domain-containing protein [Cohnella sp. JJ-181]CAI6083244.1 hypothetical protein COHCIP112018_03924 [Cohnella sp. JJ-181]